MAMDDHRVEISRMRTAIRDLVALSAIPAAWIGREPPDIALALADVMRGSLNLDFAFVRLCDLDGSAAVEVARGNGWEAFPEWLQQRLAGGGHLFHKEIVSDIGSQGSRRGVVIPIGANCDGGLVAAASDRADFPTEIDQLLLSVATNQAATAFQSARLIYQRSQAEQALRAREQELRKSRDELEIKVAQRTAELRQTEAYLSEAQRLTHTGSWVWRVEGREALHLSEECYRIYGFDPAAGLPVWDECIQRLHPGDQAIWQEAIDRAIAEKSDYEVEFRIVLPSGAVRYIHSVGHPILDSSGELVQFVGSSMDVTERKRAESLRDGESRILEMIVRDAPLEEVLESLVGIVEAQFAGMLCSVLLLDEDGKHVRHGAAPSLPKPYIEAINGLSIGPNAGSCGTAMYRGEPVVVTDILRDPLWEPYRAVAEPYGFRACWSTPILAHSGKVLGSFAMYYREPRSPSPAETRVLEMATHLAGIAIERKLAREERERLRQAQADLAHITRMTTMGELTASLAHEIKQPITAAVTNAKTCLRWLARDHPNIEEAREAAARIVKDSTRAADIISGIRLLFKKSASQRESLEIAEIIGEMVVLLRNEAARYSISIRTELDADLPPVMADSVLLQQVFMNIMLNGIEAMSQVEGTRELTVKAQRGDEDDLVISVSDTGMGLPAHQADQIFNAFFTTKPYGTGMGLPISRSIIESHGGRLWASSNPGRGTTFQFTLPTEVEAPVSSPQLLPSRQEV